MNRTPDLIKRKANIEKINSAIKNGALTGSEISEKTDLSVGVISWYSSEGWIELPYKRGLTQFHRGKIGENKTLVDCLLFDEGESLEAVGKIIGLRRQRIGQYVEDPERHKRWEEAIKRKRTIKSSLENAIIKFAIKKGYDEGVGEAVEYYFDKKRSKRTRRPLKNLIELVKVYKQAEKDEIKLTHKDLGELSGIKNVSIVGYILKEMGLKSFYWNTKKKITSEDKKEAIMRAANLNYLNCWDLGHFLDITPEVISRMYRNAGIKKPFTYGVKRFGKGSWLSYRDASQIYGFKDEFNASNEEISRAIGKDLKFVEYALKNRPFIGMKLIRALQVLYPNEKI